MESPAWTQYRKDLKNPGLWLAHEEESIGFETKYNLCDGKEVVEPFALIVPTTKSPTYLPPTACEFFGWFERFFWRRTHIFILCGCFVREWHSPRSPSRIYVLQCPSSDCYIASGESQCNSDNRGHRLMIQTSTSSLWRSHSHMEGTWSKVDTGFQVGPGKERPDRIESLQFREALLFTIEADEPGDEELAFPISPVTAQFHVPDDCYPSFQMLEDEDYDWTPTVKQPALRSRIFSPARIPLPIRPKQEEPTKLFPAELVHYLSPDARVPVFVAPESVEDLQQKSIDERDALTPRAQSMIIAHDGSDIVQDRYSVSGTQQQPRVWLVQESRIT